MATSPVTLLKEGNAGRVTHFTDDRIAGKLMTMGILPGSRVTIVRIAPLKGGYYLKVDGVNMAVRVQEAKTIMLEI